MFDSLLAAGATPNVQVFGALIKSCCANEDRNKAFALFDSMLPQHGVAPNKQCLGLLTNACAQASDGVIAKLLLAKLMRGDLPFMLNVIDGTQLAMALCRASPPHLQDAMTLFEWMGSRSLPIWDTSLIVVLLDGCAVCQDLDRALVLFEKYTKATTTPEVQVVGAMLKGNATS